ncbi:MULTISPECIES: UDP-N-acetylmuramate dehydrogenase [Gordonia]|uniref:UDP-N-acetylenolpyruvoylglucosamine reductase n=1 Tax=Gordonia amicalis TaxID=89053 RepID=A0AAE4RBE0_9ACTN|nr:MULTISPECIES: UDP-N-acetylmuramate dehydrogenase [Gordonia]ATD69444.1 UDP-N-acetylenolpyruvoylglucosamine reductase [Gordonia sp. 1D]KAF0971033.1 UDP-N-acetylenolpyruvoylglucosamine reductase [Gordonia sp. YY1]MBA5846902.1 UDP-N-acetylmuramate dehydrogenase [Gordonia amicalis]MCZ4579957.1 UDP-N-acetylmuramate dehydrogenase [Gordonia amicalis]MDJ0451821.1 UDP-N-acetylmuramate dehydrogenase [Gordonia amicalis]
MTDTQTPLSAPLAELTTLRLGGPAREIVRCSDTRSIVKTILELDEQSEPVLVIGGGSNLVIGDAGFDGTAVVLASSGIEFGSGRESGRPHVVADAGVGWDDLVAATVEAGFGGLECLSGIPGAAGATPVQNVGAYGVEVADILRSVQVLDRRSGTLRWVSPTELGLGYRTSNLKHRHDFVVVAVSFWLNDDRASQPIRYRELATKVGVEPGERVDAVTAREAVLGLRRGKGMVLDPDDFDTWSAGSFFTNPIIPGEEAPAVLERIAGRVGDDVAIPSYPAGPQPSTPDGSPTAIKLSAGWLIERAGFVRGYPGADAAVRLSTKHTLALTNRGSATTEQLLTLAREVRDGVFDAFGVTLRPEPVFVNCAL